jgi:MFS family permease
MGISTAIFKIKAFRRFLSARFFLTMAIQLQSVALGWQVYDLTKDPFSLGLIGLFEAIPYMLVLLFSGHWADIYKRKTIAIRAIGLFAVCALFLTITAFNVFGFDNTLILGSLYLAASLIGLSRGLSGPSIQSMLPQLMPRDLLANAITWNTSAWQVATVAGPAIGGLVYGFYGKEVTYILCAFLVLVSLFLFSALPSFAPSQLNKETIFKSLSKGFSFVWNNKLVLSAISLDLFAVLFGGAVALLPMFADKILQTGPEGLGILRSAPAIGAIIMGMIIIRFPLMRNSGLVLLSAVGLFGCCIIGFAISDIFWISFLFLLMSGAFDAISVIIRSNILQFLTPDEMRGRVTAINSIFIGSSNEIGAFESGLAAKILGLVPSVIFGGAMTIGITFFAGIFAPKLRNLHLRDHVN